ncbi:MULTISPECIES: ABC transporter permease [Priestia]|jgi:glycine betaine/proline transport system permease protein|uniref:ABC transporter permease n=1 Tax=Priestia TaxID=2800373 RepID=UPI0018A26966|nr:MULTISPECIES: proline/glycine betaine ABC transporter permease [Priestia]MDR7245017.1 glycine betaine/proline transport system permease protein [Priestia megaterium]QTL50971.1 proline/glycine betaine ABC transporter permease [Priestia aryabhattai]
MMVNSATIPRIPLDKWANSFVDYMIDSFSGVFTGINQIMTSLISSLEWVLTASPPLVTVVVFVLLALWLTDWKIAVFTGFGLLLIISLNLWEASMLTLSLVLASTIISLLFGVPLGILSHRFNKVGAVIKPILDIMQTMPAFVYLIPSVLLFGLGNVTALIATFIFAMPPAVRLTLLGLQQVPQTTLEAAEAFGATEWQKLIKVQLPLALPMIMSGVNQVIMLSLSMVVISSMVGAGGLGAEVLRSISMLDVGLGFIGGIAVVIIAVILDRLTHLSTQKRKGIQSSK